MAINCTLDHNARRVNTACTEQVTLQDFFRYQTDVWSNPAITGYDELFDARFGDFSSMSYGDFLEVAKRAAHLPTLTADARLAVVVTGDLQDYLSKFYLSAKQTVSNNSRQINIFKTLQEAETWLSEKG